MQNHAQCMPFAHAHTIPQSAHENVPDHTFACRYRTQLCSYGADCKRGICFFAHSYNELRVVDQTQLQELERQLDVLGDGSTTFGFPSSSSRNNNFNNFNNINNSSGSTGATGSSQQGGSSGQATPRGQVSAQSSVQKRVSSSGCAHEHSAAPEPSPAAMLVQLQLQLQQQERAAQQQQQAAQAASNASQLSQQEKILQAAQLLGVDPSSLAQFQSQQQAVLRARSASQTNPPTSTPSQSALVQAAMQLLGAQGAQALTAVASRLQQQQGQGVFGNADGAAVSQPATPTHGDFTQLGTPLPSITSFPTLTPVASLTADVDQMAATMKLLADMGLAPRQQAQAAEAAAAMARAVVTPRQTADFNASPPPLLQPTASLDSSLDAACGSNAAVNQLIQQLQSLSSKLGNGAPGPVAAQAPAHPAAPPPQPAVLSPLAQTYSLPANAFSTGSAGAQGSDMQAVMSLLPLLAKQLAGGSSQPSLGPCSNSASGSPSGTPTLAMLSKQLSQTSPQSPTLTGAFGSASGMASAAAAAAAAVGAAAPPAPTTPMCSGNGSGGGAPPVTGNNPVTGPVTGSPPHHAGHAFPHATLHPAKPSATFSLSNSFSPVDVLSIRSQRSGVINSGSASCAGSDGSCSPPPSHAEHSMPGLAAATATNRHNRHNNHPEAVENVEMDDLMAHPELLGANRMLQSLSALVSGGSEGLPDQAREVTGVASFGADPIATFDAKAVASSGSAPGSRPGTLSGDSAAALLGAVGDRIGTPRPSVDLCCLPVTL